MKIKRHSVFRSNLILNIATSLLIAVMVLCMFRRMSNRFYDLEMQRCEDLIIGETANLFEDIANLSSLFTQSRYNATRYVASIHGEPEVSDYYNITQAQSYLSAIVNANTKLTDAIMVFPNSSVVLTGKHIFLDRAQFLRQYQVEGIGGVLGEDAFTASPDTYQLVPGGKICRMDQSGRWEEIAFAYSVAMESSNHARPSAYVYLLFSYDALMENLLTDSLRQYGILQVCDREGELLCSYEAEATNVDSQHSVTVHENSIGMSVTASLSDEYFPQALSDVNFFITICIISVVLLSFAAALFLSWQQARPLRALLADIEQEGLGSPEREDEYAWLKKSINRMNRESANVVGELEEYQKIIRANTFERMFIGTGMTPEQRLRAEDYCAELERPFMVGLARFRVGGNLSTAPSADTRMLVLIEKLREILPSNSILYSLDSHLIALLVPAGVGADAVIDSVNARIRGDADLCTYGVDVIFGHPISSLDDVSAAFDAILVCGSVFETVDSEESFVRLHSSVVDSDDAFTFRNLQQFYSAAINADLMSAQQSLSTYMAGSARLCGSLHQRFYTVKSVLTFAAHAANLDDSLLMRLHYDSADDGAALVNKFETILFSFCEQLDAARKHGLDGRVREIVDYIHSHYSDPECCPAVIAAAFGISEKHLYNLMKMELDTTPAALLLEIRLTNAAQLLRRSDESIQNISEHVGFSNFNTFYKAFRRTYAVSPSQYRTVGQ